MGMATVLYGQRAGALVLGLPLDGTIVAASGLPDTMTDPAARGGWL